MARLPWRRSSSGRKSHLPTLLKFGAFVVVALVLLVGLAVRVGNISLFTHRTTYQAQLADVTGLQPNNAVKIAGVTVGQVTGISVQRGHALVTFSINNDVHLRSSTKSGLQQNNVLGQQFLYLYPGSTGKDIQSGYVIPLSQSIADPGVGAFLNALGPFLSAVNPAQANTFVQSVLAALQGNQDKVDQLINDSATVAQTVGSLDTQVGQVIDALNQVFTALAQKSSDVGTLLNNLQSVSQTFAAHNDLLDTVVTNLSKFTGQIAAVVQSNQGNLATTISDLQSVTSVVQDHEKSLSAGVASLGAGFNPYTLISNYGQWFQVKSVYTCLAGETTCFYNNGANPPAGSGPFGSPPPSSLGGVGATPNQASAPAATSPESMLQMVAGSGGGS
ncbi:MAG TPA: MCE family protein [Acidimicrobiales bacterium]|jgi:phospholipid/cholesterol/gamma-HCH transport system substrate-binding protein